MYKIKSLAPFLAVVMIIPTVGSLAAQDPAKAAPAAAPIPAAILAAKSVFIANAGADGGLFPHPFSGDSSRGYSQFYAAMKQAGEYELAGDPSQADLVLELRLVAPYGPTSGSKQLGAADPLPTFHLVIYDRRSHYVLWAFTETVELALKQQTHDRNFDEAINNLVADFQALTHQPPLAR